MILDVKVDFFTSKNNTMDESNKNIVNKLPEICVDHILTYLPNKHIKGVSKKYNTIAQNRSAVIIQLAFKQWVFTYKNTDVRTFIKITTPARYRTSMHSVLARKVMGEKCTIINVAMDTYCSTIHSNEEYMILKHISNIAYSKYVKHLYQFVYNKNVNFEWNDEYVVNTVSKIDATAQSKIDMLNGIHIMLNNMFQKMVCDKVMKMSLSMLIDMVPIHYLTSVYDMFVYD